MKAAPRLFLLSCFAAAAVIPAGLRAQDAIEEAPAPAETKEGKHKDGKKKDKDGKHKDGSKKDKDGKHKDGSKKDKDGKHKDGSKKDKDGKHKDGSKKDKDGKHKDGSKKHKDGGHPEVLPDGQQPELVTAPLLPAVDAKGAEIAVPEAKNNGNWCTWLQDHPGRLYENKDNPWIESFEIGGRFHYQAAYVEGEDARGRDFNDHYDEYRRLRLETKTEFLKVFTAELNFNLVADDRFRDDVFTDLEWGYDRFDEASLQLDVDKLLGTGGPFDDIKLKYGRMKLKMTEEIHMSSNDIYTIERSGIADKLGGEASRPTGATLELDKGNWKLVLGIFSAEDDADFLGGWNDGQFYYGSLSWKATKDLELILDYSQNDQNGADDALGYAWATSLSAVYEKSDWGVIGEAIYGDNGGVNGLNPRRQGDFHAFVVMPWYWIVKDRLQAVVQYQFADSVESQGLQLPTRYIRAGHDDPAVDVDNGRGNKIQSLYGGLNYHICKDRVKIMGGVSYDNLTTRRAEVKAVTYQIAFRTSF